MCFQGDTVKGISKTLLNFGWKSISKKTNKHTKKKTKMPPSLSSLASPLLTSLLFCHSCYLGKLQRFSQYLPLSLPLLQDLCKDSVPLWTLGNLKQIIASVTNGSDCNRELWLIILVKNVSQVFIKDKKGHLSNSPWHCCC